MITIINRKEDNKLLGQCIKQARKKAKLTQKELAERIGSTQQALANYESGSIGCSAIALISIAKALDVSVESLLPSELFTRNNFSYKDIKEILEYIPPEDLKALTDILDSEEIKENTPATQWAVLSQEIAQKVNKQGQDLIKQFIESVLSNPVMLNEAS